MRIEAIRAAWFGFGALILLAGSGCAEIGLSRVEFRAVDPEEAAERATIGAVAGGLLGAGLAAVVHPTPLSASIGFAGGAGVGAALGVATAQPLPRYGPVVLPAELPPPGFYDAWPPGYRAPPIAAQTPPPPPG